MGKCKANYDLMISDFKMPKPDPEEIKKFIECFGDKMQENQIKLLQLMADNIFGFYFKSHNMKCKDVSPNPSHICIFAFEHEKAKGEITIFM